MGTCSWPTATSAGARRRFEHFEIQTPKAQALFHDSVDLRRSCPAAVASGVLYAAGGMCPNGTVLDSVEAYDPQANEWRPAPPMLQQRYYFGMAAHDGVIYAFGGLGAGHSSGGPLASVEALDLESQQRMSWQPIAPLPEPRAPC